MKKVTFKEYFATLFGGIWQAVLWVIGLFGYKDESSFGKIVKRIFATCVTILMLLFTGSILYLFVTDVVYEEWIKPHTSDKVWDEKHISNHIVFQHMYYSDESRIYDENKKKVLLEDVDWVVTSDDKDSLAVFARKGKRGYINRFTGEVAIPEIYTRAWIFSEGLAAVEKDGELLFIDHSGKVVIDKDFQVHFSDPRYAFMNGYCIIKNPVDGKMGLIDKAGNWVLNAEYDDIFNYEGFWRVKKDGRIGLYTAELNVMFPVENTAIYVYDDAIEVRHADHTARRYDYEGNVVVDFMIDEVNDLQFETKNTNCRTYMVYDGYWNDYYGLLGKNGEIITKPIYTSIQAITENQYLCFPDGVIINDRGEILK